jgi:hypothetical protein
LADDARVVLDLRHDRQEGGGELHEEEPRERGEAGEDETAGLAVVAVEVVERVDERGEADGGGQRGPLVVFLREKVSITPSLARIERVAAP